MIKINLLAAEKPRAATKQGHLDPKGYITVVRFVRPRLWEAKTKARARARLF